MVGALRPDPVGVQFFFTAWLRLKFGVFISTPKKGLLIKKKTCNVKIDEKSYEKKDISKLYLYSIFIQHCDPSKYKLYIRFLENIHLQVRVVKVIQNIVIFRACNARYHTITTYCLCSS